MDVATIRMRSVIPIGLLVMMLLERVMNSTGIEGQPCEASGC